MKLSISRLFESNPICYFLTAIFFANFCAKTSNLSLSSKMTKMMILKKKIRKSKKKFREIRDFFVSRHWVAKIDINDQNVKNEKNRKKNSWNRKSFFAKPNFFYLTSSLGSVYNVCKVSSKSVKWFRRNRYQTDRHTDKPLKDKMSWKKNLKKSKKFLFFIVDSHSPKISQLKKNLKKKISKKIRKKFRKKNLEKKIEKKKLKKKNFEKNFEFFFFAFLTSPKCVHYAYKVSSKSVEGIRSYKGGQTTDRQTFFIIRIWPSESTLTVKNYFTVNLCSKSIKE